MSITFWFPGDTTHIESYDCDCVDAPYENYEVCPLCKGDGRIEFVVDDHAINMGNSNAFTFAEIVLREPLGDYFGTWSRETVAWLLIWCDGILKGEIDLDYDLRIKWDRPEFGHYLMEKTRQFRDLCDAALMADQEIHWS